MGAAIETQQLRMIYNPGLFKRRKIALEGLDLKVPEGSIFGYLGQNGAGKTSTIKILAGLQYATSGRAFIRGIDIRNSTARSTIGFMPENPYFYEYLTAVEMLEFYGQLSGLTRVQRSRRAQYLLERFGLTLARNIPMREFSKGMRQRLGLAQAILHEPPLVILDEPMSGLDPLGRRDIRNVILELRDQGHTVFFSSHILSDVEDICDRVCVIHQGRKMIEGPLEQLLSSRIIEVKLSFSGIAKEGHADAAALALRSWHDGMLYHLLVQSEDRAVKVKNLLECEGAILRAMIPHRESLEEYFVRITDRAVEAGIDAAEKAGQSAEATP